MSKQSTPPPTSFQGPANRENDLVDYFRRDAIRNVLKELLAEPGDSADGALRRANRWVALVFTCLRETPSLALCTHDSILFAMLTAARLKLEPGAAQGYSFLIPRNETVGYGQERRKEWRANFQVGYHGIVRMLYRSPRVRLVDAKIVHANDEFDIDYGESRIVHRPVRVGPRGDKIGAWAKIVLDSGEKLVEWMNESEIIAVRDEFSQGYDPTKESSKYSPWTKHEASMWRKTVLKRCSKYAPQEVEARMAVSIDDQIEAGVALATASVGGITVPSFAVSDPALPEPDSSSQMPDFSDGDSEEERQPEPQPAAQPKQSGDGFPRQTDFRNQ